MPHGRGSSRPMRRLYDRAFALCGICVLGCSVPARCDRLGHRRPRPPVPGPAGRAGATPTRPPDRTGLPGWDAGGPALAAVDLLPPLDAPPPGRLILPGCGRGHDALLFAGAGFDVLGEDLAPLAVAEAGAAATQAGVPARFALADLFD